MIRTRKFILCAIALAVAASIGCDGDAPVVATQGVTAEAPEPVLGWSGLEIQPTADCDSISFVGTMADTGPWFYTYSNEWSILLYGDYDGNGTYETWITDHVWAKDRFGNHTGNWVGSVDQEHPSGDLVVDLHLAHNMGDAPAEFALVVSWGIVEEAWSWGTFHPFVFLTDCPIPPPPGGGGKPGPDPNG